MGSSQYSELLYKLSHIFVSPTASCRPFIYYRAPCPAARVLTAACTGCLGSLHRVYAASTAGGTACLPENIELRGYDSTVM